MHSNPGIYVAEALFGSPVQLGRIGVFYFTSGTMSAFCTLGVAEEVACGLRVLAKKSPPDFIIVVVEPAGPTRSARGPVCLITDWTSGSAVEVPPETASTLVSFYAEMALAAYRAAFPPTEPKQDNDWYTAPVSEN